jgi:hypothetical protein
MVQRRGWTTWRSRFECIRSRNPASPLNVAAAAPRTFDCNCVTGENRSIVLHKSPFHDTQVQCGAHPKRSGQRRHSSPSSRGAPSRPLPSRGWRRRRTWVGRSRWRRHRRGAGWRRGDGRRSRRGGGCGRIRTGESSDGWETHLTQVERKAHHPTETYATIGVLEESSDGSQRVRPSLVRRTRFDRLTGEVLAGQPDDVGDNGVWDTR